MCCGDSPIVSASAFPVSSCSVVIWGSRFVDRVTGADVRMLGTIIGCHLDGVQGWPGVCNASLDEIQRAGLNWTHIRTGPFTAEGEAPAFAFYLKDPSGLYDLNRINPDYMVLLERTAAECEARGIILEIDLFDRWVRQHGASDLPWIDPWSARNNVQHEEHGGLGIFQSVPDWRHEAALHAILVATCRHPNVVYSTGNEGFKSSSLAWESRVVDMIHALCPTHPVGANSPEGAQVADYVILHQSMAAGAQTKPVVVNEYGPDITPAQVVNEALAADCAGTYFMYWRGPHSAAEWFSTMDQLGQIRAGNPPPRVCVPSGEDGQWSLVCKARVSLPGALPICPSDPKAGVLLAAQSRVARERTDLFNGNCLRVLNEENLIAALEAIAAALRDMGECAGRMDDAVFIKRTDGDWQEEHAIAWSTGCFTSPDRAFKYTWRHPEPAPCGQPAECPLAKDDAHFIDFSFSSGQFPAGWKVDATPKYCGFPLPDLPPGSLGNCGTKCCVIGVEGGTYGIVCQQALVDPVRWEAGPSSSIRLTGNPYTIFLDGGPGASATIFASWRGSRTYRRP